ncbi:outer membrane biosynthesis protein TonB [Nitrobacteraceae bacterium AZCC 1564]
MLSSELLTRAGVAVSVTGHVLLLVWVIFFAGAHPFEPRAVEAIAVEIVTPDDIPQPAKQEPQETPKPPDTLTLPEISDKKPAEDKTKPAEPPAQEASAPPPAAPPPAPPPPPEPQAASATPPSPQVAAAPPPQAAAPSQQPVPRAEPDITEKYGMMFTMPGGGSGDFDAQATQAADVSTNIIAALRAHLKTCTPLPKSVAPSDNIQIVLRVSFTPDGRLATDPMLIKGPRPSPKVLAMLQGAISGLQSCQPYTMLPADKYQEWRSVDLTFTPRDFGGG